MYVPSLLILKFIYTAIQLIIIIIIKFLTSIIYNLLHVTGCEAPGIIRVFDKIGTLIDISTFHPISFYKLETEVGSIRPNSPRITTLGLSV